MAVSYIDLHSAEISFLKEDNKELREENRELTKKVDILMTKLGL